MEEDPASQAPAALKIKVKLQSRDGLSSGEEPRSAGSRRAEGGAGKAGEGQSGKKQGPPGAIFLDKESSAAAVKVRGCLLSSSWPLSVSHGSLPSSHCLSAKSPSAECDYMLLPCV